MNNCFENSGVYALINNVNGKMYVGSTTMTLKKRLYHHISLLRAGTHKNNYLQNAWNKYGEENFTITILEFCPKSETLCKEQVWLDMLNSQKLLYNINPLASGTPNMSRETIEKRSRTMKKKYESGEMVSNFKGHIPWNKGLTKETFDFSYLKVPKKITPALKKAHAKTKERNRQKMPEISVYDKDGNYFGTWNCSKDLEEWSLTELNNLPIKSRFKDDRMGVPKTFLSSCNIMKSYKTGETYKGLYFCNKR